MNPIFGYVSWGESLEPSILDRMSAAMVLTTERDVTTSGSKNFIFGSCLCDSFGTAPVYDPTFDRWLLWDGRIDNGVDLAKECGCDQKATDPELVLHAYEKWGQSCPEHIVGDFAFAIWDTRRRALFCARDAFGVRPFYYVLGVNAFFFSSQIPALLAGTGRSFEPELEEIANYLAASVSGLGEKTCVKGVRRLLPRHCLLVIDGQPQVQKYWDFQATDSKESRTREDWVCEFGRLFQEAIKCCLRSHGAIYSDLSGGLDSSSIVCVADKLLEGNSRDRFSTITQKFSKSNLSDETKWSSIVAERCGFNQHFVDVDVAQPFSEFISSSRFWDEPSHQQAFIGIAKAYQQIGGFAKAPVLLTGIGAEAVVMDTIFRPLHLADLLRQGRIRELHRNLARWQHVSQLPLSNIFLDFCLKPLFSPPRVNYGTGHHQPPAFLASSFAKQWDVHQRAERPRMPKRFGSPATQWQYERLGRVPAFLQRGFKEKSFDIRYPFLHRPLVELALQAPWSAKLQPGKVKPILTESMNGVLPEEIRKRSGAATFGQAAYRAFQREWNQIKPLLESPLLVELGCIDRKEFDTSVAQLRVGYSASFPAILSTLALESWLSYRLRPEILNKVNFLDTTTRGNLGQVAVC
jgi:asparagine synthase (glutamine-hydrolysing)